MANIAEMTADELERYMTDLETRHRQRMKTLRALQKAREAEEAVDAAPGSGAVE